MEINLIFGLILAVSPICVLKYCEDIMQIVIVGDGKVGLLLTQKLTAEEHNVTVVDNDSKVLEHTLSEYDAFTVHGHGASQRVLTEAKADTADLLIAATSSDEVNLLSCLIARKMGCKSTIARVRSLEYSEDIKLLREELGLSMVVNPEEACAREIFRLLQFPSFLAREQFAKGQVEIVRIKLSKDSPLIGLPLANLRRAAKVNVLICAVDRDGEVTIPHGDFVLREGDEIFVTAASLNLAQLIKNLGLSSHKVTHVTIVGGSLLAYYLAQMLLNSGVAVKIIEKNAVRCRFLSEHLPSADIVEGDGTDRDTLLSEGVDRSDALVSLTNIDEENIVLSTYVRQLGIRTTITKCNRDQYADMFRQMGLGSVVSPKLTVTEDIVRYVRAMDNSVGGQMVTLHQIAGGKAEALEFRADETSKVLDIPLSDLNLQQGILIAGISRGHKTIIPNGSSTIRLGDAVVVVTTCNRRVCDLNDILA